MEKITFEKISLIGKELFRKNNDAFYKDPLSPIMQRIFIAANRDKISEIDGEFYMKSGSIHNRIFYIYSENLLEHDKNKLYDIVYFNGELCIWFYSYNVIESIGKYSVSAIFDIYKVLIDIFMPKYDYSFSVKENNMALKAMAINLIQFVNETYGIGNISEYKKIIANNYFQFYTEESVSAFIDDVLKKSQDSSYFVNREYLDSYMLLKKDK